MVSEKGQALGIRKRRVGFGRRPYEGASGGGTYTSENLTDTLPHAEHELKRVADPFANFTPQESA